jgi:hypothetical protein
MSENFINWNFAPAGTTHAAYKNLGTGTIFFDKEGRTMHPACWEKHTPEGVYEWDGTSFRGNLLAINVPLYSTYMEAYQRFTNPNLPSVTLVKTFSQMAETLRLNGYTVVAPKG